MLATSQPASVYTWQHLTKFSTFSFVFFQRTQVSQKKGDISDVSSVCGIVNALKRENNNTYCNSSIEYTHIFIKAHDLICNHLRNVSLVNMEVYLYVEQCMQGNIVKP
jgi:hypothetical protein